MPKMGRYCKAYPVAKLRAFKGWVIEDENRGRENVSLGGKESGTNRGLTESDYLYLQENFTVTRGIFKDENVVLDNVTPEWISFSKEVLGFEAPPPYEALEAQPIATRGDDEADR